MTTEISQQESIRKAFMKSERRLIAKKFGIRYQIVFKAVNPKYAPKVWRERLENRHAVLKAAKVTTEK